MRIKNITLALSLAAALCGAVPSVALAHDNGLHRGWYKHGRDYDGGRYERRRVYDDRRYYRDDRPRYAHRGCRTSGTTGAIIGAGAGALLGRSVDRYGDRLPGTIIGAGAGALIGKEIGSKSRC
ncbi:glycine zipper 2TM domain-containing protein [Sphingobium sp. EM0848]|uniref:glycine zipper 2TM domain-containing protein n=1 Tax=Sphingobium sp. EM0848 TaxID=2743473 RepID=UPI00159C129D|nr:glycine zipper 2TM domain-containing protein [Sphingobium sp. EM0848]